MRSILFGIAATLVGLLGIAALAVVAFALFAVACPGLAVVLFVSLLQYLSHLGLVP